jgi:hypothetical protein
MEGNILSGGIENLYSVKEKLMELSDYKENSDILSSEEAKLERNIQGKEKSIIEEVNSTIKKRKDEIEAVYDEQIEKAQTRIRKIRSKKEKSRNVKITERIEAETADLQEEYRQLQLEGKNIFKQSQVPSFCNSKLYYSLFMPKGLGELIIIGAALLLTLLVIPCGVYFFLLPVKGMIYLTLVYFASVILFGGIYMLIDLNTKGKYRSAISKVRIIRNKMIINKKKRNQIKNRILKDKDESPYGLEKFNQELKDLDNEVNQILEQKKDALAVFENTTRFVIGEEIKLRNQDDLNNLKAEYERVSVELKKTEGNITVLSMEIAGNYEAYLGKELMSVKKLDQLIELMKNNNLATVSDAITLLTQEEK